MRAVRFHEYGGADVLRVEEIPTPTPGPNEVLIRVRGSSLNPADIGGREGSMRLVHARHLPHTPGYDVAGVVERCGAAVTAFLPGEPVFGMVGLNAGAHAEYVCVAEERLARAPESLEIAEAGVVPLAGLTALQGLRRYGRLEPGQRLLVNGAAGGVGSFAVQIGKAMGCHVVGVGHTDTLGLIAALGADEVLDYTAGPVTEQGGQFDLVLDTAGNLDLLALRGVLAPEGRVVSPRPKQTSILANALRLVGPMPAYRFFVTQARGHDLALLARLIDGGAVRPSIERSFGLDEIRAAHRHVEGSRSRGKVGVLV